MFKIFTMIFVSIVANMLARSQVSAATSISPVLNTGSTAVVDLPCKIFENSLPSGKSEVYAACGKTGIDLGPAQDFETSYNIGNKATLVQLHSRGQTLVYLLSPDGEGGYKVDEISRDLAIQGSGHDDGGLPAEFKLDLSAFAATGNISLPADAIPAISGKTLAASAKQLDVAAYAERAKTRSAGTESMSAVNPK